MTAQLNDLFGIPYATLRSAQGMQALDLAFFSWLQDHYTDEAKVLQDFRGSDWSEAKHENWVVEFAPRVAEFLAVGFGVESELATIKKQAKRDELVFRFQTQFLKKLKHRSAELKAPNKEAVAQLGFLFADDSEYALAECWQNADAETRVVLQDWCLAAILTPEGQASVSDWAVFKLPQRLDLKELVNTTQKDGDRVIEDDPKRLRLGFDLTDHGMSKKEKKNEANYCVYCHDKQGDFCSRGFPVKKNETPMQWRQHVTGELMLGCPVEEKISQMHQLYLAGDLLAAFAVVMIDNPLCALTGHRICNDCMKSCIYQKQEPVNTPEVETGVVMEVLELPWGVEIYDILMRWNPMRRNQSVEQSYTGKKAWVMGLGPAGISVTHHLLMAGCGVVAADGLRIQSLPEDWCGKPIRDLKTIWEPLSTRPIRGFGGVAEYGITVRWNKNFLTLIQLLFQRRENLLMLGDVRFGGTLLVEDAWKLGFDHMSLAVGAGLPRELRIPGSLAPGMRQANDFLMALQLTGAGRKGYMSALQLRLPVVVIGGGLTGVDTATEAQAYYIQQIEQVERWYQQLCTKFSEKEIWGRFDSQERECLQEWLDHAAAWRTYQQENAEVDTATFLQRYGGVSLVYRKRLEDSPAYRHNHEELQKALQEGVHYRECLQPMAAVCDEFGAVKQMRFLRQEKTEDGWRSTEDEVLLSARSVLCATGASPNVAYEFEHKGTFLKHSQAYRPHRFAGDHLVLEERDHGHCKSDKIGMLTSYDDGEHRVSLLGDAHPWFHGSVVKAVASGKAALPQIMVSMQKSAIADDFQLVKNKIAQQFIPTLKQMNKINDGLVEWVVYAPWLAGKHQPGQFYRVGRWLSPKKEPVALLGALDPEHPDCLVFWIEIAALKQAQLNDFNAGDRLSVMGPTGVWSKLGADKHHTIVVIGGLMAATYLRSVAASWKTHGHRVVWIDTADCQLCSQQLLGAVDEITQVDLEKAVLQYANATAIHIIGNKDLLCQVRHARENEWKGQLSEDVYWVASVYGPMQCMLKGVCAQCLQWQLDPATGKRRKAVYACSWQHQPMDFIDLGHLGDRQRMNGLFNKLAAMLD